MKNFFLLLFAVLVVIGLGTIVMAIVPKNPQVLYQMEFQGFKYGQGDPVVKIGWLCASNLDHQYHSSDITWHSQSIFSGDDRYVQSVSPGQKCQVNIKVDNVDLRTEFVAKEGEHRYILVSPSAVTITAQLAR